MFSPDVVTRLSDMLGLPTAGWEQDWPIEVADAERIGEFVDAYDEGNFAAAERDALMALLLASIDLYCGLNGQPPPEWATVADRLVRNWDAHSSLVGYWSRDGESDPDGWFAITPYLREIKSRARRDT